MLLGAVMQLNGYCQTQLFGTCIWQDPLNVYFSNKNVILNTMLLDYNCNWSSKAEENFALDETRKTHLFYFAAIRQGSQGWKV